jgi:hypothetical protein
MARLRSGTRRDVVTLMGAPQQFEGVEHNCFIDQRERFRCDITERRQEATEGASAT